MRLSAAQFQKMVAGSAHRDAASRGLGPRALRHRAPLPGRPALAGALVLLLSGCQGEERVPADDTLGPASATHVAGTTTTSTSSAPPAPPPPPPPPPEYDPEALPDIDAGGKSLEEDRRLVLARMQALGVTDASGAAALAEIFKRSKMMGQGNPAVVRHPMGRAECFDRRKAAGVRHERARRCGAPFMAPLFDPAKEKVDDAKVCIDRYEFPGLPCEYPITWVTTAQAEGMCKAIGKRLCDAHEWEGACAGALHPPEEEYAFGKPRGLMRIEHNNPREIRWAYGTTKDHAKCATKSSRSKGCTSSGWRQCGSNSYPSGAFPECTNAFGVYDLHGNVAEHMTLPLRREDLGALGGFGEPEMKGSWFIFDSYEAHPDDCRWRAPNWHGNEGKNHSNYHLGFRCCKDVR